jgi:hypothetical protein
VNPFWHLWRGLVGEAGNDSCGNLTPNARRSMKSIGYCKRSAFSQSDRTGLSSSWCTGSRNGPLYATPRRREILRCGPTWSRNNRYRRGPDIPRTGLRRTLSRYTHAIHQPAYQRVVNCVVPSSPMERMTFYQVWLGRLSFPDAVRKNLVHLDGAPADIRAFPTWFTWSPMAEMRAALGGRRTARIGQSRPPRPDTKSLAPR